MRVPQPLAPFSRRLIALLRKIPRGKVSSYGSIAALAGNPRGARQVARLLHALGEKEKLPWHRVINAQGRISLPMESFGGLQRHLLMKEGVDVSEAGSIDLAKYGWHPLLPPR